MSIEMSCPSRSQVSSVPGNSASSAACSNCGHALQLSEQDSGQNGLKDTKSQEIKPHSFTGSQHQYNGKPNGTNVSLVWIVVVGTGLAAAFYAVVARFLTDTPVKAMLIQRGWVPYVIVLLSCWAITILLLKCMKIRKQRKALSFDVLPEQISPDIRPENVSRFRKHLFSLPCDVNHNFLLKRIVRALDHFESRNDLQEVAGLLRSQSDIDSNAVDST